MMLGSKTKDNLKKVVRKKKGTKITKSRKLTKMTTIQFTDVSEHEFWSG